jgi:hypothetical protein
MKKWILIVGLVILAAGVFCLRTKIMKMIEWNGAEQGTTIESIKESPVTEFKGPTGPPSVKGPGDRLPGE